MPKIGAGLGDSAKLVTASLESVLSNEGIQYKTILVRILYYYFFPSWDTISVDIVDRYLMLNNRVDSSLYTRDILLTITH